MKKNIPALLLLAFGYYAITIFSSGCAQVGFPTGGPTDSVAPILARASPENNNINFTGNKITLVFDEYIEIKDIQTNLLVSPLPKKNPTIGSNLRSINIRLRDTLQPNTTYSINFGNSIVDVHEGNVFKEFTYTFSTGSSIDSLELKGRVSLAETGKTDSTLMVFLYRDAVDSTVNSRRPDYVTRVDGNGAFIFRHLPADTFKIYALKDGDGGKTYNSKTELFAFSNTDVSTTAPVPVTLYAYAQEKAVPVSSTPASQKKPTEKKLKYTSSTASKTQDLLLPLTFTFNSGLKLFDSAKIIVADTNFRPLPNVMPVLDSTRTTISINLKWQPETEYYYILPKEAVQDSADNFLEKTDTLRFSTKKTADYGTILLRFKNIDLSRHPVIQFIQSDAIKFSYPITNAEWNNNRFPPGEYEIRILYDLNNNGIWDAGSYEKKLQPERVIALPQKLAIRADWENEREIQL